MKILVLSLSLPYPPTDGGKIRLLNLLRQAAKAYELTMVALETEPTDREAAHDLTAQGIDTLLVRQDPARVPPLTVSAILKALTRNVPLTVAKYHLRPFAEAVEDCLKRKRYDVIHFEMMHTVPYLPLVRRHTDAPALLSTQNVDSDVWRRAAQHQPTAWKRLAVRWQAEVFERAERRLGAQFAGITAASDRDAELYRRMLPNVPVEVADNGVDLAAYTPNLEAEELDTFVYTGSYDWLPNADAVEFLCSEIWGRIRAELPDARFFAVGKEPTPAMLGYHGRDGITVTGRVPEIQPYIERACVYVVPLRIGGGTRLKILEAMGMGKAILSTSVGAEALDLQPGRDLRLADTPQGFAEEAVRLAKNVQLRRELGAAARKRAEERYGWESIGAGMNAFYERLVHGCVKA